MPKINQWERQIGRRLRLRDLFVFFTVVECGSMAKAAQRLGVSTPSVSGVIAGLEHALGVRLLDRTSKGITATAYGHAVLARGRAAFDELRQGVCDIESIADPGAGEVRIGCPESVSAFLVLVIERVAQLHPRMRFHVQQVFAPTVEFPELRERKIDLVFARLVSEPSDGRLGEDFEAEVLFDDPFFAAVGPKSKWARSRSIDLADLVEEPWILTRLDVLAGMFLTDAFKERGLKPPVPSVTTFSIQLRNNLASRGRYVAVLPRSVLNFSAKRYGLRVLPISLSTRSSPVAVVTLRGRTLTPAVRTFIENARAVAQSLTHRGNPRKPTTGAKAGKPA